MVYRSTLDVPTRYQWDPDSRFPLPDPGTAPGNCGITCATVVEMFYTDQWHGIYTNRRLVTDSTELSSTIGQQSQILWKRGVPNAIDKTALSGLHFLLNSRLRPVMLGMDFSRVPYEVAGHPFRGSHSVVLRANASGGFIVMDPNFNRTYRTDPKHGYRFYPDWVVQTAYYNTNQWAIIPTKDKVVPSLPDTGLPSTLRADGDLGMRFREVDYARTLLPNKPIRKGVTISSGVWRRFDQRKELQMVGRIDKSNLPRAEREYGDVLITRVYVESGHVFGYVKQADLAGN